jgi:hypothetical protein
MGSLNAQQFDPENPTKPYMNTVTTAAPFLLIPPDSRSGGMGDMGVATSADLWSQHHNPAKYVFNDDVFGIGVSYAPWLKQLVNDIHLVDLATFWKITENDAIAFSLKYFSLGAIQFTDDTGLQLNTVNPNEFSLDFTYSRKLSKIVSMALTPRFIYSNLTAQFQDKNTGIDMKPGLAGAVDISLFIDKEFAHHNSGLKSSELLFGLCISNIGNKISYTNQDARRDFLPCNLRLGLTYALSFDDYNKLAFGVEAGKLLVPTPSYKKTDTINGEPVTTIYGNSGKYHTDFNPIVGIGRSFYGAPGGVNEKFREVVWAVGVEYSYRDILFVRAGTFLENKYKGNRKFATVGVGLKYSIFAVDVSYLFAFTQHHPLENALRFSLSFLLKSFNKEQIKTQGQINRN